MRKTFTYLLFISLASLLTTGCKKGDITIVPQPFSVQSDDLPEEIVVSHGDQPGEKLILAPQLSWKNAPQNTAQFIVIMDDNNATKPHIWWLASISSTLTGLVQQKLQKSILPDIIPLLLPISKPLMPWIFPDANQGGLITIMPYCEPNRWNKADACTLEIFALKSVMSDGNFKKLKSQSYSMEMSREQFISFCKSLSIEILGSAKKSYRIRHLNQSN